MSVKIKQILTHPKLKLSVKDTNGSKITCLKIKCKTQISDHFLDCFKQPPRQEEDNALPILSGDSTQSSISFIDDDKKSENEGEVDPNVPSFLQIDKKYLEKSVLSTSQNFEITQ